MLNSVWRTVFFSGLILISAVVQAMAEIKPEVKFQKLTDLPSIGLKIHIMPESKEAPVPPPEVRRYTFTQGDKKWDKDMYSPIDLWRASQHAGKWIDSKSNALTIASITSLFPAESFQPRKDAPPHVPRDYYDKIMAENNKTAAEWNDEDLAKWVEAFTGAEKATPEIIQCSARFKAIRYFTLSREMQGKLAYSFCVGRPTGSTVSSPQAYSWYFILVDLNPKVDTDKAKKTVIAQFFPSVTATKIVQKQATVSSSFQVASFAGRKNKSAEFLASRQQVTDSIKNTKDWWFAETENYIFVSNMKSQHKVVVKDLQEHIEYLRDAFEQFMPPRKDIKDVSVVRAFATTDEYLTYVGKDYSWSFGLWSPTHRELVIRPIEWGGSKLQRDEFFRIVYHEAFHQYLFYAFDQKETAVWFNEGHAEFYSPATVNERKFTVGENPKSINVLEKFFAKGNMDIDKLIHMKYSDFYSGTDEARQKNYALAWLVVYYLRKGAVLETPPKYAKILDKYSEALWENGDGEKATDIAFEGIDMKAFQREVTMFWTSQKKRGAALRNNIFKAYNPALKK